MSVPRVAVLGFVTLMTLALTPTLDAAAHISSLTLDSQGTVTPEGDAQVSGTITCDLLETFHVKVKFPNKGANAKANGTCTGTAVQWQGTSPHGNGPPYTPGPVTACPLAKSFFNGQLHDIFRLGCQIVTLV